MNINNLNESFGTLSQTLNGLVNLGYTHDFNIKDECIVCHKSHISLAPEEFKIDRVYRFEGASDPEYQSILYAISSDKYNIKGTLINGYGLSADEHANRLIERLNTNHQQHQTESKSNNATPQRPEGDRVLDAPLVEINLIETIAQLKGESSWTDSDRNSITLYKSDTMRIVMIGLHENAEMKPHKANGVISVQVIEGKIAFSAAQQHADLEKGRMITLQGNVFHSVKALSETFFLLTLCMSKK